MIDLRDDDRRARLVAVLGVRRWVDEVVDGGPYPTAAAVAAAAERAMATLTDAELDEALARQAGDGEQAHDGRAGEGLARADEGVDAAIARGSRVYEQRFGRPLLVRRAGRSLQDVADELDRRLKNDSATEAEETRAQLRRLVTGRLEADLGGDA